MIRCPHRFAHRFYLLSNCVRFILTLALLCSLSQVVRAQAAAARPNRGLVATNSYAISDIERVNLTNGNLNLSIPLASLPPVAGGKLGLTLSANYNSKMWDTARSEVQPDPLDINSRYAISQLQLSGGGWSIGARYFITFEDASFDYAWLPPAPTDPEYELLTLNRWSKVVLYTPDGATHELRPKDFSSYTDFFGKHPYLRGYYKDDPNTANASLRYYSFDGSHLWVKIDPSPFLYSGIVPSWTLYLPDGTKVEQSAGIQRITDTNGNKIKIWVETDGAGVTTTHNQDELTGREIRVVFNPAGNGGQGQTQVQYQTVGGAWTAVTVNLGTTRIFGKTYWINDALCPDAADFVDETITVFRSIIFPQTEPGLPGKQFTFNYNSDTVVSQNQQWRPNCFSAPPITFTSASEGWGSLSRIVMPSGATVDYTYTWDGSHVHTNPDDAPRESLETKALTHDGMTDTWTYGNSPGAGGVTNPDGSQIIETMYPYDRAFAQNYAGFGGKEGLVYRIDNSGKTRVERHWTFMDFGGDNFAPGAGVVVAFNPVVDAEYTSLMDGGQPVKMSAKTFQYDFNCNLLQEIHYDWFDPALVSRDAQGVPTGVPSSAVVLRVVNHSYYNQATTSNSPNVYARRDLATVTPRVLNAPQQSIVGPSQTQFSYDNQAYGVAPTIGNLTRVSNWDDQAGVWRNTAYGYDSFGNRITITDPRNNVTNIAFDPATHAQPTQVTVDPLNGTGAHTTTTVYDFWTGLVTSVTDPNNQTTTTDYTNQRLGAVDPFGRPGIVTGPPVNSVVDGVTYTNQQRKVKTTYFDDARQVVMETDLNQSGDFKLKARSSHDQLGRAIKAEGNEDGAANYSISTENVYIQPGLITLTSNPKRSAAAATDGWIRATRDLLGRVIEVATFSGATQPPNTGTNSNWTGSVTTSYNANQTTVTDQAGKKRRNVTDALGRLVSVTEDPGGLGYETIYLYDALDNLRKVTQGAQTRWFAYDSLSRLIRAKNPEQEVNANPNMSYTDPVTDHNGWSMAYSYDANGNLVSKRDARNITTTYGYDAINRNTTVSYSDSTPGITSTYDTATLGKGQLQKAETAGSMGSRVTINAYDAMGRPLSTSQQFFRLGAWGTSYTTQQTYDLAGNIKTVTYPSDHTVNYSYDPAGRISSFSGNLGGSPRTYADTIGHTAAGKMVKERFGTNTSLYHNSHYNNRQQLVSTRVGDSATDESNWSRGAIDFFYGSTAVANGDKFANDTDNNGNLRRQINWVPLAGGGHVIPQRDDYTYDALNRVSSFTEVQMNSGGQWTPTVASQNFSYDRFGNRQITGASGGVSNYNPTYDTTNNNNRIVGLGYDAAGNITFDPHPLSGGTMTYDAEGRLRTATSGGGGNYVYNADGKRVRRITAGGETWYVYGCGGELLAEYAADGSPSAPQKEYGYRNGQLLVIAEPGSGGNLAWGKATSQSSTGWGGNSIRGVDGNTNGSWSDNSVTHTQLEHQPWWLVDLGSVQQIGTVKLWNRTDCCSERLSNFYVLVSDNPFSSTDLTTTINQAGVSRYYTAGPAGALTEIGVGRSGRYVRVQLDGDNYLSIAEVEVIAEPGSGGGTSFVKPALKSSTDLIGKAGPGVDGAADGLLVVDEPVADLEFNEDSGSTTADVSSDNNTGTLIDGVAGTTAKEYGNAPSANDIGGESLAEHPAGAAPNAPQKEYRNRRGLSIATAQGGGVVTVNPSANQTPVNPGDYPVSSPLNTGHGQTFTPASAYASGGYGSASTSAARSAKWSAFPSVSGTIVSIRLKFNWSVGAYASASADGNGGSASSSCGFGIEYSLDGGSSWIGRVYRSLSASGNDYQILSDSGSEDILLSASQNITQVQIRTDMSSFADATGGEFLGSESQTDISTSISSIRIEVETDTTAPVISNIAAGGITAASATITWTTNENSDSQVEYGPTTAYGQSTTLNSALVTAHSQGLSGLTSGTLYHYRVKSRDAAGNLAVSGDFTFTTVDNTAPVISNVAAGGVTATSATITWNTNENSDSQVEYGPTTAYGQSTTLNSALVTAHSQGLSGLTSGTLYHYRVKSRDAAGNLAVSGDFSFTTAPDTTPPTVTSFSPAAGATNVNANANVTVTFSEAMNAATVNGSTVELRDPSNTLVSATVSYNPASLTATLDPTASLVAGVTYTARVRGGGTDPRVKDVAGNALAADVTWTFTTAQNGSGGIKWLVTDHLGSTRMVIDETGSLAGIKRHDFAPFGEELSAGIEIRIASLGYGDDSTRQKLTSKERDAETGLDYFLARYYSSIQGRFTSPDEFNGGPIELFSLAASSNPTFYANLTNPQSLNKYQYCYNSPLKYIDPDGHAPDGDGVIESIKNYLWSLLKDKVNWKTEEEPKRSDPSIAGLPSGDKIVEKHFEALVTSSEIQADIICAIDPTGVSSVVKNFMQGKKEDAAIDGVLVVANFVPGGKGARLIGERMVKRVLPVAEEFMLKTYAPREGTDAVRGSARFIERSIAAGKRIFDIGPAGATAKREAYIAEVKKLVDKGYHRVYRGTVQVGKKTFEMWEWVRRK